MKRFALPTILVIGIALMLASLYLLSQTTQNSAAFESLHVWLLLFNAMAVVALLIVIATNLLRLINQYRQHVPGSRLTARLVTFFVLLAVVPVVLVYYFSLQFINRGIDSWFDVRVERALDDALELSRTALDLRVRDLLTRTRHVADELQDDPTAMMPLRLDDLRREIGASELTVFGRNSRILSSSSNQPTLIVPDQPSDEIMLQVRQDRPYVGLDPIGASGLHIRAVVPIFAGRPDQEDRVLQALFPVAERQSGLAESVQAAYTHYRELTVLRTPLKYSFILTLSLVLLLSLLGAVWGAFYAARRLVAPIQDLAEGTRAVARGDFNTRLPMPARDEVGFLVLSFNEMTSRLAEAREAARRSRNLVESERAYLEAVLGRLSSGVLTIDSDLSLRTANSAAGEILGEDLSRATGKSIAGIDGEESMLGQLLEVFRTHLEQGETDWGDQIVLAGSRGRRVLMCRCKALPPADSQPGGHVLVFDDLTALFQAQRDAAWGEVARRLAHEIKNPLTPIQLAAERLRRKYLGKLGDDDGTLLDRATQTIVQQVDSLKAMVNAFSEYARAPELQITAVDLNEIVQSVAELYPTRETGVTLKLDMDPRLPPAQADAGRIRQMLHNLIKNSIEALEGRDNSEVSVRTHLHARRGVQNIEILVEDNGPGFGSEILDHAFDPYVTSKPKGTGLGLAIVKKLVEEHGGTIHAENLQPHGARVVIRLPIAGDLGAGQLVRTPHRRRTDRRRQTS